MQVLILLCGLHSSEPLLLQVAHSAEDRDLHRFLRIALAVDKLQHEVEADERASPSNARAGLIDATCNGRR